ncbi:MAG: hypothetical protein ACON31_10750 [Candidatus Puniceispirillaceae bacterium]
MILKVWILKSCEFYARQIHLIAVALSAVFALVLAVKGDAGTVSFDLYVLFYGGLCGYALAGCLMVPVFIFLKLAGVEQRPSEAATAMEALLFRRRKRKGGQDR